MAGYTKLHAEILDSTIWREDDKTRLVFITLLAMANQHGEIMTSIPGLADRARVSLKDCEYALDRLMAPDPYSRTPDNDGRRVGPIAGGYLLLNYEAYRKRMDQEHQRNLARDRKARSRAKQSLNETNGAMSRENVTESTDVTRCHDKAEAEAEADKEAKKSKILPSVVSSSAEPTDRPALIDVVDFWNSSDETRKVRKLSRKREQQLRARLKDSDWFPVFKEAVAKLPIPNDEGFDWQPDFDWMIRNDSNAYRLAEGSFDKSTTTNNNTDKMPWEK